MSNHQKTLTGNVIGTAILFLSLFSILCDLLKTDVIFFVSLSDLVKDANVFITVTCIVYITIIICKHNSSYKTILIYALDILLINRLYSNSKWKMLYSKIRELGIKKIILFVIILAIIIYVIYGIIINQKNKRYKVIRNISENEQGNYFDVRQEEKVQEKDEKEFPGGFTISAIIAFALVILLFLYSDKLNFSRANGKFLSAISDNILTFVFAFIIFFMIFQIACMIFLNILTGNKINKGLGYEIKICIERVEKKMVKLACNIIEGCISLLDFVPDFFTTIGLLLLDEKIDIDENDKI